MDKVREAYQAVMSHAGPPDLQAIEDAVLDRLQERLARDEDELAKAIAEPDEDAPDAGEDLDSAEQSLSEALAKGIVVSQWVDTAGGPVHIDDVTEATLTAFAQSIGDYVAKALEPVAQFMRAVNANLGATADLATLNAVRLEKALGGVSASAVRNYGRPGTDGGRTEPIVTTGTPLSKGGAPANGGGLLARIAGVDANTRKRRLAKAIEAGAVEPGRASMIDQILYNAAQIADAAERDKYINGRITEAETAALLGQEVLHE